MTNKKHTFFKKNLNNDMAIVKTWLDEKKIKLNKTKSMLIGNKQLINKAECLNVRLYMDSIEQVGECKYLGVWIVH